MSPTSYAQHLCVGVDMRGYSARNGRRQENTQSDLVTLLNNAAREAVLDRGQWLTQPTGDGELSLIPLDGSEPRVLYHFAHELDHELTSYNQDRMIDARMRLRVAIHQGVAYPAANGYAGKAVVVVSRLLDSEPVRNALDTAPRANLALILSAPVYDDMVRGGHTRYRPEAFRQVAVDVKDYTAVAWLWIPHHDVHGLPLGGTPAAERRTRPHAVVGAGSEAVVGAVSETVDGMGTAYSPDYGTGTRGGGG